MSTERQTRLGSRGAAAEASKRSVGVPDALEKPPVERAVTPRVSFPLRADGRVDVESLRAGTRDTLKKMLGDSTLQASLGLDVGAPVSAGSPGRSATMDLLAGNLCLAVGMVNAIIMQRSGIPAEIVKDIAPLTDEQTTAIVEPLGRVLSKYLGATLDSYGDEAALVIAVVSCTTLKLSEARAKAGQPVRIIKLVDRAAEPTSASAVGIDPLDRETTHV